MGVGHDTTYFQDASGRFHEAMDDLAKARNKSPAKLDQAEIDALQSKTMRLREELARIDPIGSSVWAWECVPLQSGCRWFVRRGATTKFERGFRSKAEASKWIDSLRCEWRVGFMFHLHFDTTVDMQVVDRNGKIAHDHKRAA